MLQKWGAGRWLILSAGVLLCGILVAGRGGGQQAQRLPEGGGKVVMYGTSWCGYCRQARAFLDSKGVPYREYDIERDPEAGRAYARLGGRGIPLLLIGRYKIAGFAEDAVSRVLKSEGFLR